MGWASKARQRLAYALQRPFFFGVNLRPSMPRHFPPLAQTWPPSFLADRAARRWVGGAAKRGEGLPSHRGVEFEPRSG